MKWEYSTLHIKIFDDKIMSDNNWDWELVAIYNDVAYFKRPKPTPIKPEDFSDYRKDVEHLLRQEID